MSAKALVHALIAGWLEQVDVDAVVHELDARHDLGRPMREAVARELERKRRHHVQSAGRHLGAWGDAREVLGEPEPPPRLPDDPAEWPAVVSHHALERFNRHHPGAADRALVEMLVAGVDVAPDVVAEITRSPRRAKGGPYVLSPDGQGVFVLADRDGTPGQLVVTYLRLGLSEQDFMRKHYLDQRRTG